MIDLNDDLAAGGLNGLDKVLNFSGMFVRVDHQHFRTGFALRVNTRVLNVEISNTASSS